MITDEQTLLARALSLEGLSLRQLAARLEWALPADVSHVRKGWIGQAVECYLGGEAGNQKGPDFQWLGIELKTLPLNALGKPAESTFVSTITLPQLAQETWETSSCFAKLKRVLWVPVEGDRRIPFDMRRLGRAFLWSPTVDEKAQLVADWQELTSLMVLGRLQEVTARLGECLQVRPKAANGKSLSVTVDEAGERALTLPRGFYLRASFTAKLLG